MCNEHRASWDDSSDYQCITELHNLYTYLINLSSFPSPYWMSRLCLGTGPLGRTSANESCAWLAITKKRINSSRESLLQTHLSKPHRDAWEAGFSPLWEHMAPISLLILTHPSLPKCSGPLMSERFACPTRKRGLGRQGNAARGGVVEVLSLGRRWNQALLSMTVLSTPEHKLATPGEVAPTSAAPMRMSFRVYNLH